VILEFFQLAIHIPSDGTGHYQEIFTLVHCFLGKNTAFMVSIFQVEILSLCFLQSEEVTNLKAV
jgi:hypothetical protein